MKVETPIAFSFIMQEELYLLTKDKTTNNIAVTPPAVETQQVAFNFLGGNKKNFLVVVYYPALEFIEKNHFVALENILKRLGFSVDDTAVFNKAKYKDTTALQLMDFFKPEKMLLLGQPSLPKGIGLLAFNKPQHINNCHTLFSFSFDEMMDNNENKKIFWEQMKLL